MDRRERKETDRSLRLRAARHSAVNRHASAPTQKWRVARAESIQARGALGRKSRRAGRHGRSLSIASILRMARARFHLAIGATNPRYLCRMGRRAALQCPRPARNGSESRAMRRSAKRRPQAGAMQTFRQRMHARASHRRADGFFRRLVRGVLQLRASQDGHAYQHQRLGLKEELRWPPPSLPKFVSTSRKLKWRMAPAAKPAAD